jgi:preprotein translocase subunit SecG
MLVVLVTIVHVIVCLFLVIVVLLQSGKAADLAGAFGGMGSQTAFGPRGAATILSKATTVAAGLFMATSLTLSIIATRGSGSGTGGKSVLDSQTSTPPKTAPATPGTPAPGQGTAPAGQPSVTITPEGGGPSQTIPLDLNKLPVVDPKTGKVLPPGTKPPAEQPAQPQQKK